MNSAHPANITSSVANNSDTSCVDNNHQPEGNKEEEQEEGYVRTAAQNYVSRKAHLYGTMNIEMKGKGIIYPEVMIRGDFGPVRIGRYVCIGSGTIIRPPSYYGSENQHKFLPIWIGSYTSIGENCIIESSSIGESVKIGSNVVLGKRSIIKDCVYVESNTVVPPDMALPPFSIVSGSPARISSSRSVPESALTDFTIDASNLYKSFVETLKNRDNL